MKTKATNELPEIDWRRGDFEERHDQLAIYNATGESVDGRKWEADWEEIGEDVEISKIEEA